jgi:hypothetical protein
VILLTAPALAIVWSCTALSANLPGECTYLKMEQAMRMTFGGVVLLLGVAACASRSEEGEQTTRVERDTLVETTQVVDTMVVERETTVAADTTVRADTVIVADTSVAVDTTVAVDTARVGDEGVISVDTASAD